MKFRTTVGRVPVSVIVRTDDTALAVRLASRIRGDELFLVDEQPYSERAARLSASELRDKAELFRAPVLRTAFRLLADAMTSQEGGRELFEYDERNATGEQGVFAVECFDGGSVYTCGVFLSHDKAREFVVARMKAARRDFAWIGTDDEMRAGKNWEANATDRYAKEDPLQFVIRETTLIQ